MHFLINIHKDIVRYYFSDEICTIIIYRYIILINLFAWWTIDWWMYRKKKNVLVAYLVLGIFRVEDLLKSSKYRCLKNHSRHFTVPSDSVQHFRYVMIDLVSILIEFLQKNGQRFNDLYICESTKINYSLFKYKHSICFKYIIS